VVSSIGDQFLLANTRLAIQDPTPAGNQPFADPSGRYHLVFNGEVYNFRALAARHRLSLRSGTDTEVLVQLWARFGPGALAQLRGMFAVAVADTATGELFLARDPFGIKPLHWRRLDGAVVFASEIRPLAGLAPWTLDRAAISDFLAWGSVGVERTPFREVFAVPPGTCLRFAPGEDPVGVRVGEPVPGARASTPRSSPGRLAAAFRETVALHLVTDVPAVLLLSAGLDSSLIAQVAAEQGQVLQCVTVGGELGGSEAEIAARTAAHFGHRHLVVPAAIEAEMVDRFLTSMQRPSIDGLNTFVVSKAVHDAGFKVALSGLGGDEALGGYAYARLAPLLPLLRALRRAPGPLRAGAARVLRAAPVDAAKRERLLDGPPAGIGDVVSLQRELFPPDVVRRLVGASADGPALEGHGPPAAQLARAELVRYLQPTLLPDADANSMAWSVELRVPYVDPWFFSVATARRRLRAKPSLVRAMGDPYLRRLARRPKTGFSVPMARWLDTGPLAHLRHAAADPRAPLWEVLDPEVGLAILRGPVRRRWSEQWALTVLDGWLRSLRR